MELNKRQQQYQATLERIRLAVDKLVETVGFEQMRIQDICREAEISPGNFYHYFSAKQELLVDRYKRCNSFLWDLYEDRLTDIDALKALGILAEEMIDYTRTRKMNILIPYHQAMIENNLKWQEEETSAFTAIAKKLIHKSLEDGILNSRYSEEEINRFLCNIIFGSISQQCMTRGEALSDSLIAAMTRDWIEGLRNTKKVSQ